MNDLELMFWREVHRDLGDVLRLVDPAGNEMLATASGHALSESIHAEIDAMRSRIWGHMKDLETKNED